MKFAHIIKNFKTTVKNEWDVVRNRDEQSMWLYLKNNPHQIHVYREVDNLIFVRLYYFGVIGTFDENLYRITIGPENIIMCSFSLKDGSTDRTDIEIPIKNYKTLLSEDSFFQNSLVENVSDIDCDDLNSMHDIYNFLSQYCKDEI